MNSYEDCAALLQYPLISDAAKYAHFLHPDGRVMTFDARGATKKAFRRVQANGVGNHCRWMLTDEALIVRRTDGSYLAKPRPPELPFSGGDSYRTVFSFSTSDADLIVLSTNQRTFVVRVDGHNLEEETLALEVRCFDGCSLGASGYMLVGQRPRTGLESSGPPMLVSVEGAAFKAKALPSMIGRRLDAVVAVLSAAKSQLLVCAEAAPPPSIGDPEESDAPGASDHDDFWVVPQDENLNVAPARMENCRFIGRAGPLGVDRVFVQLRSTSAAMASVRQDGAVARHDIAGLPRHASILRIQFDPLVGWFGIADEHNATRDRYVLSSSDGVVWRASALLRQG